MSIEVAIAFIVLAIIMGVLFGSYVGLPNDKKIDCVKEWLKYAVVECEKALGSGTGQIKLRMAYDMAVKQFPWLATMIDFNTFSLWVDEALVWLEAQMECNVSAKKYIQGEKDSDYNRKCTK